MWTSKRAFLKLYNGTPTVSAELPTRIAAVLDQGDDGKKPCVRYRQSSQSDFFRHAEALNETAACWADKVA